MTDTPNLPSEVEKLRKVLSDFKIETARTPTGKVLAYSVTEPLFCYERESEEELVAIIGDTLKSYAVTFYHFKDVEVQITSQPLPHAVPEVPIERIEPISRLLPSFGDLLGDRQLAGA